MDSVHGCRRSRRGAPSLHRAAARRRPRLGQIPRRPPLARLGLRVRRGMGCDRRTEGLPLRLCDCCITRSVCPRRGGGVGRLDARWWDGSGFQGAAPALRRSGPPRRGRLDGCSPLPHIRLRSSRGGRRKGGAHARAGVRGARPACLHVAFRLPSSLPPPSLQLQSALTPPSSAPSLSRCWC